MPQKPCRELIHIPNQRYQFLEIESRSPLGPWTFLHPTKNNRLQTWHSRARRNFVLFQIRKPQPTQGLFIKQSSCPNLQVTHSILPPLLLLNYSSANNLFLQLPKLASVGRESDSPKQVPAGYTNWFSPITRTVPFPPVNTSECRWTWPFVRLLTQNNHEGRIRMINHLVSTIRRSDGILGLLLD